ncbi:ABC transporter permease [Marivibrio halodurans]|uniref:ABC transporter permease n=1 Tax=Marivibrio halodurans TaxID=2039722 RepID=A0A8J7RYB5_9PROT|nr:ABC transporter permease [Marivibrio halodurans]MBP5856820.1 ABC transporter permease [Marivibrio halodurans]
MATTNEVLKTVDGEPLKVSLARAQRRSRMRAVGLVAPLLLFLLITFLFPIGEMLFRSVQNPEINENLPRTVAALEEWDDQGLPPEEVYAAAAADLAEGAKNRTIGRVGTRLNYEISGGRSLITRSARRAAGWEPPYKEAMIDADEDWGDPAVWLTIKRESDPYTLSYYLDALDMKYTPEGDIVEKADYYQIHVDLFWKTIWMSILITFLTLLLGYPVAYLMATLPLRYSNLLMILVLLPFWTSLLVRTTTWIAILQSQGVLNDLLVWVGVIGDDGRLQMIYNEIGTVVAMTHILLPFMILPLYSVMKTIPPSYMRAARSLGAPPTKAYIRVYVPQTVPGIGAGGILVFILSIGYYITPALVGGESGRFITNFIAYHMQSSLNWGLAAALGSILLALVLILYWLYNKLIGIDSLKFS